MPNVLEERTYYKYWDEEEDAYVRYNPEDDSDEESYCILHPCTEPVVIPHKPYVLDETTKRNVEHFVKNFATLDKCKLYTVYDNGIRDRKLLKIVLVHEGVLLEIPVSYIMASTLGRNCGSHDYPIAMYTLECDGYAPVCIQNEYYVRGLGKKWGSVLIKQGNASHRIRV